MKYFIIFFLFLIACEGSDDPGPPDNGEGPDVPQISDEDLLDLTQRETFRYFWDFAHPASGAARERYHPDDPGFDLNTISTGGTGFGMMAILVAAERNFISRAQTVDRLGKILDFLESADRFHGAWPHWIDGNSGRAIPFSAKDDGGDLVETAFLCQGLLCVKEYFKEGSDAEMAIAGQAEKLWQGVEWNWYTQGQDVLYWHWSPNFGFEMDFPLIGYNEVLITYVLAASSDKHAITPSVYHNGWASNGGIVGSGEAYGYPLLVNHQGAADYGGPLFWAHYSYLGLNPKGLSDAYADYGEVNRNQALINYNYCVDNPKGFEGYSDDCWGLTASYTRNNDGSLGYAAHAPGNDLGIISPTAALASMPYTPSESMKALRNFYQNKELLLGPAGFFDAFAPGSRPWVARAYLAIDQGPVIAMIENHRTALLWNLFMQNESVQAGLERLGFTFPK
jgi:hypothetical protein